MSKDMINHPDHYKTKNGLETIDVIEAFTEDLTGIEAVCTGNALKYICRWNKKNGVEDINKAIWYLKKLREELHKKEKNKSEGDEQEYAVADACRTSFLNALRLDSALHTGMPCETGSIAIDKGVYLSQFLNAGTPIITRAAADLEDFLLHLDSHNHKVVTVGNANNTTQIVTWSDTNESPICVPGDVRRDIVDASDGCVVLLLVDGHIKAVKAEDYDGRDTPLAWKK